MGRKAIDLTGQRFNRLFVLCQAGWDGCGHLLWTVICDCGTEFVARGSDLKMGRTRSCGCLKRETSSKNMAALHAKGRNWKFGKPKKDKE